MNPKISNSPYLVKVIESIWAVAESTLGENHLLTQAFETALRTNDHDLMVRSLKLLSGSPDVVKQRLIRGVSATA